MKTKLSVLDYITSVILRVLAPIVLAMFLWFMSTKFIIADNNVPFFNYFYYILIASSIFFFFLDIVITAAKSTHKYYYGLKLRNISVRSVVIYNATLNILSHLIVIIALIVFFLIKAEYVISIDIIYLIVTWVIFILSAFIFSYMVFALSFFQERIYNFFLWLIAPILIITPIIYYPTTALEYFNYGNPLVTYINMYSNVLNEVDFTLYDILPYYIYESVILLIALIFVITIHKRFKDILIDQLR